MFPDLLLAAAALPPNRDYITTGGLIICTMLTGVAGVLVALIQSNRKLTKRGMRAAESAAERSAPTGNGYAPRTEAALKDLKTAVDAIGRDVGGIRSEARETNRRLNRVDERLTNHLEGRP